jgi:hypothetical protein
VTRRPNVTRHYRTESWGLLPTHRIVTEGGFSVSRLKLTTAEREAGHFHA